MHERMVRNVFLNIELLLNDGIRHLSEYDIQSLMFLYFRRALANSNRRADRECEGKVDCVVYEDNRPVTFYEVKTYYKPKEKLCRQHFDHDLHKIAGRLSSTPNARGYLMIAGARKKFRKEVLDGFDFIAQHLSEGSRKWVRYSAVDGNTVRLRPSRKEDRGLGVVVTWEVRV